MLVPKGCQGMDLISGLCRSLKEVTKPFATHPDPARVLSGKHVGQNLNSSKRDYVGD